MFLRQSQSSISGCPTGIVVLSSSGSLSMLNESFWKSLCFCETLLPGFVSEQQFSYKNPQQLCGTGKAVKRRSRRCNIISKIKGLQ
ncbi:hypothetical protein VIGAN_02057800 [Vigna angularis var. angularis]|uniref:Uncharacterized protein n=1 Tax=Vigna angularis var. angularis TaxID=157739 RepID=A0A0S3RB22_PHAAN|nr:hypothetical protein VIGAN_02057800 [Vigna angularis var. angularis]